MKKLLYSCIALFSTQARAMEPQEASCFRAIKEGNLQRVQELIQAGADINIQTAHNDIYAQTTEGWTPLIVATLYGRTAIAIELLDNGANANARIKDKKLTALMIAAQNNNPNLCLELIKHGAKILKKDCEGDTALVYAAYRNNRECIEKIICNTIVLPQKADLAASRLEKLSAIASDALSWLPGYNMFVSTSPATRIKTALLCLKRLGMPRDIKNLILCRLPEDMISILITRIGRGASIPLFAIELLSDVIWQSTFEALVPTLLATQKRVKQLNNANSI
jgi:ankyrin repeat protein